MVGEISHAVISESVSELLRELADESGRPVSFAVLNGNRELLHFTRMDGAPYRSSVLASYKAYSAVWFGRDSVEIEQIVTGRDIAWYGDSRLTAIGGGVLIRDEKKSVLGAVGVSGRTMQEDIDVATRLVAKIATRMGPR